MGVVSATSSPSSRGTAGCRQQGHRCPLQVLASGAAWLVGRGLPAALAPGERLASRTSPGKPRALSFCWCRGCPGRDPSGGSKGLSAHALRLLPGLQPSAVRSEPLQAPLCRRPRTQGQEALQTPGRPSSDPRGDDGGNGRDVTSRPAGPRQMSIGTGRGRVPWGRETQPAVWARR